MKPKKLLVILLLILTVLNLSACGKRDVVDRPSNSGKLKVIGANLCDEKGNVVTLKGVSTHSLTRSEGLINQDCFNEISKDWNVNIVRLAMYTQSQDSYNKSDYFKEKNLELIDKGVQYATNADMYVIIDWHILEDGSPLIYQQQALEFFDDISKKYSNSNNVLYEICNEPNGVDWSTIKQYALEVIPVIRANDPNAIIIVGTPTWSQEVDKPLNDPLPFDNIMYTFHFYSASHKQDFRDKVEQATVNGLPIFVSEYGITANTAGYPRDTEEADKWMELLDKYNIPSCIWSFSKAPEAASIFSSQTLKNKEFEDEDLSDTGRWFIEMLKKTYQDN